MLLNNYPTNPLAQIWESWLFTVCIRDFRTVVSSQTCLYLDLGFSQKAFWCKSFSNKFLISQTFIIVIVITIIIIISIILRLVAFQISENHLIPQSSNIENVNPDY